MMTEATPTSSFADLPPPVARTLGFDGLIAKPFDPRSLAHTLRTHVPGRTEHS